MSQVDFFFDAVESQRLAAATEILLMNGLSVNCQDSKQDSAYHYAIRMQGTRKYRRVLHWLNKINADINIRNAYGRTPLHEILVNLPMRCTKRKRIFAAQCIVACLLYYNADPTIPDLNGDTAMHAMIDLNSESLLRTFMHFLIKSNNLHYWECVNDDGLTPFAYAVQEKKLPMISILLEYKIDSTYTVAEGIPSAKTLLDQLPRSQRRLL